MFFLGSKITRQLAHHTSPLMLIFTLSLIQFVWQTAIFPTDPCHPWLKHTARRTEGSGALEPASTSTAEGLVQAVLRKQESWGILLLFCREVLVHITLHHQCKLFSTEIRSFYLRSDLADYFVAFLHEAFIFCIASQKWPRKAESGQTREALTQWNL